MTKYIYNIKKSCPLLKKLKYIKQLIIPVFLATGGQIINCFLYQKRMKNFIKINQKKYSKFENLDIKDILIFDYIEGMCLSKSTEIAKKRKKIDNIFYTWINLSSILKNLPLLRINCKKSLKRRLLKLEKAKLISIKTTCGKLGKTLYFTVEKEGKKNDFKI